MNGDFAPRPAPPPAETQSLPQDGNELSLHDTEDEELHHNDRLLSDHLFPPPDDGTIPRSRTPRTTAPQSAALPWSTAPLVCAVCLLLLLTTAVIFLLFIACLSPAAMSSFPLLGLIGGVSESEGSAASRSTTPPPRLPGCSIPMYTSEDRGDNILEMEFVFAFLFDLLPSTCDCGIRPRLFSDFHADYVAATGMSAEWQHWAPVMNSSFPFIWIAQSQGFEETYMQRFCHAAPAWCARNVVVLHLSDEQRTANLAHPTHGDDGRVVPYDYFHTVFRQYHLPGVDDYSYLAHPLLTALGYSDDDLRLPTLALSPSGTQPYRRWAEERIVSLTTASEKVCPLLAVPLIWKDVIDVVLQQLQSIEQQSGCPIVTITNLTAPQLHALHAHVLDKVSASRNVSSPSHRCHAHSLLSFHLRGQAKLRDFDHVRRLNLSLSLSSAPPPSSVVHFTSTSGQRFSHVYWMPIGHATVGMPGAVRSSAVAASARGLLFAWSGSIKNKPERLYFDQGMQPPFKPSHAALMQRGHYEDTGHFAQGRRGIRYTSLLTDAVFTPLPAGNVPEQFRIHEALEAGSLLIVSQEHLEDAGEYLTWMRDLLLDPVPLYPERSWARFLDSLFPLQLLPPSLLDEWQAVVTRRYELHMHELKRTVARRVCGAAGRPVVRC